jgi:XRE family transcriptional regulator, regulator of sulfur utilization
MKLIACFISFIAVSLTLSAQTQEATSPMSSKSPNPPKLVSAVYDWENLQPVAVSNGVRRAVLDGPTTTLDKLHCHITTLNPGQVSGPPRLHLQEEVIIVKEGTIEATFDGHTQTAGPGSVIFFASHATTRLRNPTKQPATYTVVYYYTPLTPKE